MIEYESRVVRITIAVTAIPYLRPVYEYDIANMIGAYIPYVLDPTIYLAILTIVASRVIATRSSKVCFDIPFSKIHCVKDE